MLRRPHRLALDAVLVAAFALGLVAPTIDLVARPAAARSVLRENRNPYPFPARITGFTTLSKFPHDFEAWFDDRFGQRDRLLRGNQWVRHFVFHGEFSPTLVEGRQGFLFFGADNSIAVQRGLAPFDEEELESWRKNLEAHRDWLRARGIEYAFAIAPNKQSIYRELVPRELGPLGPTRLEQLAQWMHTHSDVRFVDLTDAMLTEKGNDRDGDCAYYPLGSHWAWRGAWAGWNTVVASLTAALPALRPIPRTACARTEVSEAGTDSMADHTYIGDLLHQRGYQFLPIASHVTFVRNEHGEILSASQPDGTLPSTLVVHDSFGTWILPFVAESSSRMTASWEHGFPKDLVQTARPDVVVQVYTERLLVWGLPRLMPDADLVDAATFAGYPVLWGPLDLAADPLPAGEGGMRVAHGDGGLRLDVTGGNSVLNLPPVEVPAGAELALRVDITAPAPTSLTIFFQLSDDRRFARVHAANVALAAGRNDVRFRVRTSDLWGPLKLHLGADGAYVLHAIEARSAVP